MYVLYLLKQIWNWGDGSYTIECNDDVGDPLTYYIDELCFI